MYKSITNYIAAQTQTNMIQKKKKKTTHGRKIRKEKDMHETKKYTFQFGIIIVKLLRREEESIYIFRPLESSSHSSHFNLSTLSWLILIRKVVNEVAALWPVGIRFNMRFFREKNWHKKVQHTVSEADKLGEQHSISKYRVVRSEHILVKKSHASHQKIIRGLHTIT